MTVFKLVLSPVYYGPLDFTPTEEPGSPHYPEGLNTARAKDGEAFLAISAEPKNTSSKISYKKHFTCALLWVQFAATPSLRCVSPILKATLVYSAFLPPQSLQHKQPPLYYTAHSMSPSQAAPSDH